ncbi:acetylcholinesterase [Ixodes scapularis]
MFLSLQIMEATTLVAFCLVQIFLACSQNIAQDIVSTKSGDVRGISLNTTTGQLRAFLGIPYAESPVGDLRFKKPEPKQPWNYVYNATSLPKMCPQPDVYLNKYYYVNTKNAVSEDCLYLNVYVPTTNRPLAPVLVYIHGGAFIYGGISMNITDTTELSVRGDLITVAIAYRLGAFGFLRTDLEDVPGNMGLYDQALAIGWVKDNIESFGGDPNKITLMGQSAGSISIGMHLMSSRSRGLFHRAIMQSGSPFTRIVINDYDKARSAARKLAEALSCETENQTFKTAPQKVIRCLRSKNASDIIDATEGFSSGGLHTFYPLFGEALVPEGPLAALEAGHLPAVDVLGGVTEAEGDFFVYHFLKPYLDLSTTEGLKKRKVKQYLRIFLTGTIDGDMEPILDRYFSGVNENDGTAALRAGSDALGDLQLSCPTLEFAKGLQRLNNSVYMYRFTVRPSFSDWPKWVRTTHADDIFFSLGSMYKVADNFTADDVKAADNMIHIISTFSKTGIPETLEQLPWPKFQDKGQFMDLSVEGYKPEKGILRSECDFWKKVLPFVDGV